MILNVIVKKNIKESDNPLDIIKGIFTDPTKAKIYFDGHNSEEEQLDHLIIETKDTYVMGPGDKEDYKRFILSRDENESEEE